MEISEKDHMKQKVNKYQTVAGEISESRDYMKPKRDKYQTVAEKRSHEPKRKQIPDGCRRNINARDHMKPKEDSFGINIRE